MSVRALPQSLPTVQVIISRILRLRRNANWQKDASFDSPLSRAGLEHLGRGWIVRGTTARRLAYWDNGLFYPVQVATGI